MFHPLIGMQWSFVFTPQDIFYIEEAGFDLASSTNALVWLVEITDAKSKDRRMFYLRVPDFTLKFDD